MRKRGASRSPRFAPDVRTVGRTRSRLLPHIVAGVCGPTSPGLRRVLVLPVPAAVGCHRHRHEDGASIRLGLYSSETAELSLRDYGGQLCLLTHCSIPSGVTGKQRPAVPLVVTCLKSRGPVAPPVGATQRAFSSSGAGGPRSHIRQGAPQCVSKGCCCSDAAWFALRWEGLLSRAGTLYQCWFSWRSTTWRAGARRAGPTTVAAPLRSLLMLVPRHLATGLLGAAALRPTARRGFAFQELHRPTRCRRP